MISRLIGRPTRLADSVRGIALPVARTDGRTNEEELTLRGHLALSHTHARVRQNIITEGQRSATCSLHVPQLTAAASPCPAAGDHIHREPGALARARAGINPESRTA